MDSRFFESKLANHKMFQDIKDSLTDNSRGKLKNLMELSDDVLYVWNSVENCLVCLNLKQMEENGNETAYQKLHFLSPPSFAVERVMVSNCGSRVCVWGPHCVTVAELPARWSRRGLFDSGNKTVLCKSFSLDERFLYSQTEVRRVHWHPNSLSHMLVLVSGNELRLYHIALKSGPKLAKIFNIGPKPSGYLAGDAILDSLGDTAVDFTPTPDSQSLLILRGNGDVYIMDCDLENKSPHQPKIMGPLAMYPPADDNYGTESCSITTLGGGDIPPLVVVATCSAALYHCLLLPNGTEASEGDNLALYVVESVELNIVLNPDDDGLQSTYPVHLYPCSNSTYACTHAGGVHSITLPILGHLKDFALAGEWETETVVSRMCSRGSVARHLVCTSDSSAALSPPVGVALSPPPLPRLLVLCSDGLLLTRTLEPHELEDKLYQELQLKNPTLDQEDINYILKQRQKVSFTDIIQEILTREVSQPILNIAHKDDSSPKESLEFLTQATMKLRSEYISRQQRALDTMTRKVVALARLSEIHKEWLSDLMNEMDDVQLQSAVAREKIILAEKHQDDIKYRCSTIVRALRTSQHPTAAERELLDELQRYKTKGELLTQQIHMLKQLSHQKTTVLNKWIEEYKTKEIALGKSHSDTITSILQQQTSQISSLIEETKLLKDQLGIV